MIVNTNLVMSYPVQWSEYSIVSNYVQNFYDSLGIEHFADGFHYGVEKENGRHELWMRAERGFAKEWLYYLGASTKREAGQRTAGGFGEGFKIASLVGYRDYHLDIRMESRDWTLCVTRAKGTIAGKECEFLAYDIGARHFEENAVLRLGNITDKFEEEMESAVSCFYYPSNPKFGKCLAEGADYAVYEATLDSYDRKAHRKMPRNGSLFTHYQMRGSIHAPVVFCNHTYVPSNDDRDREWLNGAQAETCIMDIVNQLDGWESWQVLKCLRGQWSGHDNRNDYHEPDWGRIIRDLINRIRYYSESSPEILTEFRQEYRDKLVIRDDPALTPDRNRRMMGMAWYQMSEFRGKLTFVRNCFHLLGVKTVCELCEENNGFTGEREADQTEKAYVEILRRAAGEVLAGILVLDDENWPECRVLLNPKAPVAGFTRVSRAGGKRNSLGMDVRQSARYVYLQGHLFAEDGFSRAFVTYCHELLHQFGGDSCLQFHHALLLMNQRILEYSVRLQWYRHQWEEVCR